MNLGCSTQRWAWATWRPWWSWPSFSSATASPSPSSSSTAPSITAPATPSSPPPPPLTHSFPSTTSLRSLFPPTSGLDRSRQRFLWVVRSPRSEEPTKRLEKRPEPDLEAILPEGCLDRTKDRGLVVKSWAPQVEVLAHEAVGAFVTHCGWNSTLEGVCARVPLIAWPLYAEQGMNKVMLVEELKLAVVVEGYKGVVSAAEVEAKVSWVMESEGGRELRKRATAMKEKAKEAWRDGGLSQAAWVEVVKVLKSGVNLALG